MPFGNNYPIIELDSRHVNDVEVAPVVLSQGDSSGRILRYALWDGQDAMSASGLSARFCIDQDAGLYTAMTTVAGAATATWQAAVPMGGVEAGWHVGCVRVTDSGNRVINTRLFNVYVEKSVIGGSAEQMAAYADIIAGAEEATDAATQAATAANNAAASAIAASGNRLTATITGPTTQTATDAWTGPLIGATVDGLSVQDGTPTPTVPVEIRSVEGASAKVASRNLLHLYLSEIKSQNSARTWSGGTMIFNGLSFDVASDSDGRVESVRVHGTATAEARMYFQAIENSTALAGAIKAAGTCIISSGCTLINGVRVEIAYYNGNTFAGVVSRVINSGSSASFASPNVTFDNARIYILVSSGTTLDLTFRPQVEVGGTAHVFDVPNGIVSTSFLPSAAAPLRSLPDGTHDELTVGRDGSVTVVRRVGSVNLATLTLGNFEDNAAYSDRTANRCAIAIPGALSSTAASVIQNVMCDILVGFNNVTTLRTNPGKCTLYNGELWLGVDKTQYPTRASVQTLLSSTNPILLYPLATPTTETLPSVTMPTVPSTHLTAWVDATDADGAAMASGWTATYERDVTIVIDQLEQAIADL